MPPLKKYFVLVAIAVWTAGVLCSVWILGSYEFTPGDKGETLARWPAGANLPFNPQKLNIIIAAHPHCPCSKVSLGEFAAALDTAPGAAEVNLVFYRPPGSSAEWSESELTERAARLPKARVYADPDGRIASLLGARTSFDIFTFDQKGAVVFRGGITRGRGVRGENDARAALEKILQGKTAVQEHPVYGCPIRGNLNKGRGKV